LIIQIHPNTNVYQWNRVDDFQNELINICEDISNLVS